MGVIQLVRRGRGELGLFNLQKKELQGNLTATDPRRWRQALYSGAWQIKKRQVETREVQAKHKEKLFHDADSQTVEQIAQKDYAISVLSVFKSSPDKVYLCN